MAELLKILIKTLTFISGRFFSRTSESHFLKLNKVTEQFPNSLSDSVRTDIPGKYSYLAVRVPCKSIIRFSVVFPGVLSSSESSYFDSQSWVQTFSDDRVVPEEQAETGYFLRWTDEAMGARELFPAIWSAVKELPKAVFEIHSDGTYLRVILKASSSELASLDSFRIRDSMRSLAAKILTLQSEPATRLSLADRYPMLSVVKSAVFVLICILALGGLMPEVDYIDSENGDLIVFALLVLVFAVATFSKRNIGYRHAASWAITFSVMPFMVLLSGYLRVSDTYAPSGKLEEWKVVSLSPKRQKYTTNITGYDVRFLGPELKSNRFFVKLDRINQSKLEVGSIVKFRVRKDFLGLSFIDSATAVGSSMEVELLSKQS